MADLLIYIAWAAEYSSCADCWDLTCSCPLYRRDLSACLTAIEMGYY